MNSKFFGFPMVKKDKQWHTQAMNQRRTDNTMGKKDKQWHTQHYT